MSRSCAGQAGRVVYVDSGSTDGSPAAASALGVDVVELDPSLPFSAARARNTGLDRLQEISPGLSSCCSSTAIAKLPRVFCLPAVAQCGPTRGWRRWPDGCVSGFLHARFTTACATWNGTCRPAHAKSCGGIALFRVAALRETGGFNPRVVAGEEPELCVRLRQRGWTIQRLANEMALHDAAMTRFSQWWIRAVRAGHAYAEGAAMHGRSPERHFVRESLSGWLYGVLLPAAIVASAIVVSPWALLAFLIYPLLWAKIARGRRRSHGDPRRFAGFYAGACLLAKPAECWGQTRYWVRRVLRRPPKIIQHKPACPG